MSNIVLGIDLGTTNSEVAAWLQDGVKVLGPRDQVMLPSCVGMSPTGDLLVGQAARNQGLVYPERTIRSIKRRMGENTTVQLGDRAMTPQEVSALILRQLVDWAQKSLNAPAHRAVITVPAYFSDAQRQATREAGELAGLEVLRILNEPTAASLAYGFGAGHHTALVYDLGGGTFDVSVVAVEDDVTEVLASHGNNHLGGDDFDALLVDYLVEQFQQAHGMNLRDRHPGAMARLWWAAESAKKALSDEPYCTVREEALLVEGGKPLHLSVELSRVQYERMIAPLVESTLASVSKALDDARRRPQDLDAILLVGGSTRTPMIGRLLQERTGLLPRQDVHPDLCVALGAGVMASRLSGQDVSKVLVDVSPFSFGPSYVGERGGYPYPDHSEVICRMSLDVDGILNVTAIEKRTGKQKSITIENALRARSAAELAEARERSRVLFEHRGEGLEEEFDVIEDSVAYHPPQPPVAEASESRWTEALQAIERSRAWLERMHADDAEEAIELHEQIHDAMRQEDEAGVRQALAALNELLFFVESR